MNFDNKPEAEEVSVNSCKVNKKTEKGKKP